jgi:hypothetical protein
MPIIDNASINGLLSTPLVLPASVAGALAAFFVVVVVLALRRPGGHQRVLLSVGATAIGLIVTFVLMERIAAISITGERDALLARNTALMAGALAPGSSLACLEVEASAVSDNACEQALFADAPSVARALAYTGARLRLLQEASVFSREHGDTELSRAFAATRRSIERDRFGLAAHVLGTRERCTVTKCDAFAFLQDSGTVRANLQAHAFEQYLSLHGSASNKPEAAGTPVAVAPSTLAPEPVAAQAAPAIGRPVDPRWDFPSAASIPAVSIMSSEPLSAKEAAATQNPQPEPQSGFPGSAVPSSVPMPPARPQVQTTALPPAR